MSANPFFKGFDDFVSDVGGLDLSVKPLNDEIIREPEQVTFARAHCGIISASKVAKLATYQPDPATISALEREIEVRDYQIANSTRGTKTAEKSRETKQKQLDRMMNDDLPEGAIEWCEKLAADRLIGFVEKMDVSYDGAATRYGKEHEALAVAALIEKFPAYDFRFTNENQRFIKLYDFDYVGATPDALIYERRYLDYKKATLDIKNPLSKVIHLRYKLIKSIDDFKRLYPLYYWQLVHQAMCAKVDIMCFASYCHYAPEKFRLFYFEFAVPQADADFLLSRIVKAELMIASIIEQFN